jgi:hypothetical protein
MELFDNLDMLRFFFNLFISLFIIIIFFILFKLSIKTITRVSDFITLPFFYVENHCLARNRAHTWNLEFYYI